MLENYYPYRQNITVSGVDDSTFTLTQRRWDSRTGEELAPVVYRHNINEVLNDRSRVKEELDKNERFLYSINKLVKKLGVDEGLTVDSGIATEIQSEIVEYEANH